MKFVLAMLLSFCEQDSACELKVYKCLKPFRHLYSVEISEDSKSKIFRLCFDRMYDED